MNSQEPYRLSNICLENIVYTNVKQTDKKKIILIKYQDKTKLRNLVFQTPTLLNINEPKLFLKDNMGYGEIEVALYNTDNNKINKLLNFFKSLSSKINDDAVNNIDWFNNDLPLHFQKIVRKSDTFKNGILKLKLLKSSNFETIIQKNNKQKIKMESLSGNTLIKMLLEVYAVWINTNNDFGVFLRPILVSCNKDNYNYKFIPDSDEEDEDDEIPDTEVNNNIFLKINKDNDGTTSQLEYNSEILSNPQQSDTSENNISENITPSVQDQDSKYEVLDINLNVDVDNLSEQIQDIENVLDEKDIKINIDIDNKDEIKLDIEDNLSDKEDVENVLRITSPKIITENN